MLNKKLKFISRSLVLLVSSCIWLTACSGLELDNGESTLLLMDAVQLPPAQPFTLAYTVQGTLVKRLLVELDNPENYASLSLVADGRLLADKLNITAAGSQQLSALVRFEKQGPVELSFIRNNADLTLNKVSLLDVEGLDLPEYQDISVKAGLDKVSSLKYAGPTIADIDQDGDYDFIVNNHNQESSKLYWNNGDGTVTKHDKNLARWFMHDLHGTATGDYDNDGDLDLVLCQGGGNGLNPSTANFYQNNDGTLVLMTGDVGIDKGGRGRAAKWTDMDLDGDLDLMLINESSLSFSKPQQYFYENLGDSTFKRRLIAGLEDVESSRVLITDLNNDNIDDVILYGPLSIWLGNGDFTFTDITAQLPAHIIGLEQVMAIADIDIDNDGDQDLYLARGKAFEHGKGEAPSFDQDPIAKTMSIKPRGYKGVDEFSFTADGKVRLHNYYYLTQGAFRGKDYPIFVGENKNATIVQSAEEFTLDPALAQGWPNDISADGAYFGYLGDGKWQAALVRNGENFWAYRFTLSGVNSAKANFEPENRNIADILLRNDGTSFTDVSAQWGLHPGANSLGVTTGDFNNDSYQDLFVYRWGKIGARISDYMLLNDGRGSFQTVTMHGANDVGGPGNGDMGQAFDFDLDGDLDLLNGSEGGEWYLYENTKPGLGNYALVKVAYSPLHHVDPISAEVIVRTENATYRKRVGSAGSVFSQSLLNIVHFGLGAEDKIKQIQVRWRNGELATFNNKAANAIFDTNSVDAESITVSSLSRSIRSTSTMQLETHVEPLNASRELKWGSSDETILKVDQRGLVSAVGQVGEKATISVSSNDTKASASIDLSISPWVANPIRSLTIGERNLEIYSGDSVALDLNIKPNDADAAEIDWQSSNVAIASVDAQGLIKANKPGIASVSASVRGKQTISDQIEIKVVPRIEAYLTIKDMQALSTQSFVSGKSIILDVDYHAGSGNKVISSDEGGMRYWLRHFSSKWIPAKDIVLKDTTVLNTESGHSTMSIDLAGVTPTAELPEGHFYQLRVSFTSSDGVMHDVTINDVNIIAAE